MNTGSTLSTGVRIRRVRVAARSWSVPPRSSRTSGAFTLIELILVMTILTIALSITAPALANFFRGRSMDYEARRLLALIRHGQSRAVSEGVPVELWLDLREGKIGLEAEPSYEATDPKAVEFTLDTDLKLDLPLNTAGTGFASPAATPGLEPLVSSGPAGPSTPPVLSRHVNLPRIRFLPDGTISDTSPPLLRLTGRDGKSIWLIQSSNRLTYEIGTRGK